MIIIAESGSTKTNWLTEDKQLFETIGFNPLFFSSEDIYRELMKHDGLGKLKDQITGVLFYGASCSSDDRKKTVYDSLKKYFPKANRIEVDHDMYAAALATYDGRTGIACILGTGSNSCLFDGRNMTEEVPALGYILGDEGSGAYFGKKLLALFLYHELPEATDKMLRDDYGLEKEKIFDAVYKKPHVNVYLATFAKVLTDSADKAFMEKFAEEGFTEFFLHHICCYKDYQKYPVHFVGSIAFHFKDTLKKVADKFGCELGIVDKNPVYRLLDWHLKNPSKANG
jgi:glucosamine kinase